MSLATGARMTAEEFLARDDWPRGTQLIEGEVVVNQPALPHQHVVGNIYALLRDWTEERPGRGYACLPVDVRVTETNVYGPDVWWVGESRRPPPDQLQLEGVPDLVVEVRSPGTWRYDVGVKRLRYEEAGVAELWLVDTSARSVLVYRRSSPSSTTFDEALEVEAGDRLTSPLLEHFAVDVAKLFGP
jgi:Uma2 family endonuclease